ncbi:hypothetical protein NUBL515_48270 [Klebsiella pneumoniae]|nr:hypothetical protein NUBL515_48270 [Klebsiella pneumoniae]
MINRNKLEHILEYARQQRHIGQSCKVPPEDMVEIMERLLSACNSPVVPDGYVMVPKEMTDEIGEAIAMQANCCGGIALDIYDAMLAAAPHDTPALNSVQSVVTVPGKWIPVSERMPENDGAYLCWDNRYVTTYAFIFGAWQANQFIAKNITHWMPLPAGPQEVR